MQRLHTPSVSWSTRADQVFSVLAIRRFNTADCWVPCVSDSELILLFFQDGFNTADLSSTFPPTHFTTTAISSGDFHTAIRFSFRLAGLYDDDQGQTPIQMRTLESRRHRVQTLPIHNEDIPYNSHDPVLPESPVMSRCTGGVHALWATDTGLCRFERRRASMYTDEADEAGHRRCEEPGRAARDV